MNCINPKTSKMPAKLKRAVPNLYLTVSKVEDYNKFTATDQAQAFMFGVVIDTIKHGITENKPAVDIFQLPGSIKSKSNTRISLHKKEWKPTLKRAIKFYSKLKQYEKCIDCQQLINTIQ
jgi:hypothetical protein